MLLFADTASCDATSWPDTVMLISLLFFAVFVLWLIFKD